MEWLIIAMLVIGIVLFILKKLPTGPQAFPYRLQDTLFTPAERSFYGVLCQAAEGHAVVMGQVRVADVITTTKGLNASDRQKAFNKISSKHFDYVLCKPDDLSVIAVVELDDSSHNQKNRIARDEFLEGACEAAGLKLHRFKARGSYNISEVREELFPSPISDTGRKEPTLDLKPDPILAASEEQNVCPKCSSELVRRTATKGQHKGSEFLACGAFPKCRYIEKLNT